MVGVCLYPINVKTAEPIRPKFCVCVCVGGVVQKLYSKMDPKYLNPKTIKKNEK